MKDTLRIYLNEKDYRLTLKTIRMRFKKCLFLANILTVQKYQPMSSAILMKKTLNGYLEN